MIFELIRTLSWLFMVLTWVRMIFMSWLWMLSLGWVRFIFLILPWFRDCGLSLTYDFGFWVDVDSESFLSRFRLDFDFLSWCWPRAEFLSWVDLESFLGWFQLDFDSLSWFWLETEFWELILWNWVRTDFGAWVGLELSLTRFHWFQT